MVVFRVLLAAEIVVLAAMGVPPVRLAPADDCVTVTLWLPSVSPVPVIVDMPNAVPPLASSTGAAATTAVVADTLPLLTSAWALASWLTVNVRLPALAEVVAVAVALVGTVEFAANTFQPAAVDSVLAASFSDEILVLIDWYAAMREFSVASWAFSASCG